MGTKLAWERVKHVFVCVAEGSGAVEPEPFDVYFRDVQKMDFTHFLTLAKGSPTIDAKSRQRMLELPGVANVRLAVVFDGSPIVRGTAVVFSWFMPNVKILPGGSLHEALDYLGVHGDVRDEVLRVVSALEKRLALGTERGVSAAR